MVHVLHLHAFMLHNILHESFVCYVIRHMGPFDHIHGTPCTSARANMCPHEDRIPMRTACSTSKYTNGHGSSSWRRANMPSHEDRIPMRTACSTSKYTNGHGSSSHGGMAGVHHEPSSRAIPLMHRVVHRGGRPGPHPLFKWPGALRSRDTFVVLVPSS